MRNSNVTKMVLTALLCSIGMIIPIYSPFKILIEPASFTLASHVAIFIAMLISPMVALAVSLGTAAGFFLSGLFPLVVVLRALTHVVFAFVGATILTKDPSILNSKFKISIFSLLIGILHAIAEVAVVSAYYFGNNMSASYYANGYVTSVLLLVGVGTVIHSMVDLAIALVIWKILNRSTLFRSFSTKINS